MIDRYEVYNKDPTCIFDRVLMRVFRVVSAPDRPSDGEDLDLQDLVARAVDGLNRLECPNDRPGGEE